MRRLKMKILEIKEWKPFTSLYPERRIGNVEIKKTKYRKGYYLMEGVGGYELFYLQKSALITVLKIDNFEVMVDDPLHYIGMSLLAKASNGKVLTAGLGLGLYTTFLQSNSQVSGIVVVELNKNVIALVKPLIHRFIKKSTKIIHGNILNWAKKGYFDTIMLDLWAGRGSADVFINMIEMYAYFASYNPRAKIFIWGLRDPFINPAVSKVSEEYLKFVSDLRRSQTPSRKGGGEYN
jgi:spermidine synthase